MYAIGAARRDITCPLPGLGMLGWAMWENTVEGVGQPIHARAFVFVDPDTGRKLAIAVLEICFVTQAVKEGVVARLEGWDERDVLLTATHTHSAPGGYSHHILYNLTVPGFVPEVFEAIAGGTADAIREAEAKATLGRIRPASGEFPAEQQVAFNRSLAAHNLNRDLPRKYGPDEAHLAVDREMTVLRLEDEVGNPLGLLDWFPVHPINVHNDNHLITPDNKGFAATMTEAALGGRLIAAFAQGAAADVSPNWQYFKPGGLMSGRYEDDFASARYNGRLQADLALELFTRAGEAPALTGELDAVHGYFDFVDMPVPPRFADGFVGKHTGSSAIGVRMLGGTEDGRGITSIEVDVIKLIAHAARARAQVAGFVKGADAYRQVAARFRAQDPKDVLVEPAEGRIGGTRHLERMPLPELRDPMLYYLKRLHDAGATKRPWAPHVLPLQLMVVGSLAIAAFPAELTTQAGRRLRASIREVLAERGVTRVLLAGYANAYAGYVTTPEEYDRQDYEGASTHFGRWTLGAYQACFEALAQDLLRAPAERTPRDLRPPRITPEELAVMSHDRAAAWRREWEAKQ